MSSISKDIGQGDLFDSGIPLVTGAPRPSDVPIEAQEGGRFGEVYLSTPSSGLAYAFGEAAKAVNNLKVNSLTPGLTPQKHVGEGANALEQADLSPALEQFRRLLRTPEVSTNVPGIGNSQVPA
jgi:hypothetical protein